MGFEASKLIKQGINLLLDTALLETNIIRKILQKYMKNGNIQSFHDLKTRQ
jgi:divalent metal cation (Fe/Co/Zn/Cd) transporter